MIKYLSGVLWFILLLAPGFTMAQEGVVADTGATLHVLQAKGGTHILGKVLSVNDSLIVVETTLGRLTLQRSSLISAKQIRESQLRNGVYWPRDPNETRLFLAPKGRMLDQGTGYFQNIYLFFNGFAAGITDNLAIGGGMTIFPIDNFWQENVFYFTPKIGTNIGEYGGISAGALIVSQRELDGAAGAIYGAYTNGNERASTTVMVGVPFYGADLQDNYFVMLGADIRIRKGASFITENWLASGGGLVSYGLRFFGEKLSVDLALINAGGALIFPGIPYVDFVVNF